MIERGGWIKLHRKIREHPMFQDHGWLAVWIWMLFEAAFEPKRVRFKGQTITLQPGQFTAGRYQIADSTGVHPSKVQRVINMLKIDQQIDQQISNECSLFTILNWQKYQCVDQQDNQPAISQRSASDQPAITTEELKKERTEEEKDILSGKPDVAREISVDVPDNGAPEAAGKNGYHRDARTALHLLNEGSGRHYRETDANLSLISARLKEGGVDIDGVRKMIDRQCRRWKSDPKMCEYLRPATLFAKSNFDSYYAARDVPLAANGVHPEPKQIQEEIHIPRL